MKSVLQGGQDGVGSRTHLDRNAGGEGQGELDDY